MATNVKPVEQVSSQPSEVHATVGVDNKNLAIVGLVVNLFLPGLGTIIGGGSERRTVGIWQLVLALASFPLMLVLIGFIIYPVAWIWH